MNKYCGADPALVPSASSHSSVSRPKASIRARVYVVAGGDFPDSVFSTEAAAEAYCERQRAEDKRNHRRIYWRIYEYELDGETV